MITGKYLRVGGIRRGVHSLSPQPGVAGTKQGFRSRLKEAVVILL